jgi:hypothetical protein
MMSSHQGRRLQPMIVERVVAFALTRLLNVLIRSCDGLEPF